MGKRSREKATGKSFKERFSEAKEILKVYRPARKMAKRMRKTGDYGEFRDLVAELEDEDIEEFLHKMDRKIDKHPQLASESLIVNEYTILVEERKRRENGRQEAGD